MPDAKGKNEEKRVPKGFTPGAGGLASEYAREQGWAINEDERRRIPLDKQDEDGGTDYDYGAADFGDEAKDTSSAKPKDDSNKSDSNMGDADPVLVEGKAGPGKPPVVVVKANKNVAATPPASKRMKKSA
jgi:hypothetical protein